MPLPVTPRVRILKRIEDLLENADLDGMTGLADIHVRQTRNRWAAPDELPCISIRMVSDTPRLDGAYHSAHERLQDLEVDLQIDAELATEDSDLDPTGLERLGQMGIAAVKVLKDFDAVDADGNKLRDLCDDIEDHGVVPDEDNEADEGRFIHRIVVLYRVRGDDPSVLLASGENYA